MMYPDVIKTIELIDAKILELQKAKQTLIEAFGGKVNSIPIRKINPQVMRRRKSTRKDTIIKLLKSEGPLRRAEIINKGGIPKGTVSSYLNDKETFVSKNGLWHLISEEEKKKYQIDRTEKEDITQRDTSSFS